MIGCKICGNKRIFAKVTTDSEKDNRKYCNGCFISIMQAENLLSEHAQRMFITKAKHKSKWKIKTTSF